MNIIGARVLASLVAVVAAAPAASAEATFSTRSLNIDAALAAATAALDACRAGGYQVGVAVTDRSGVLQVYLRDRFAGAHTVEMAVNKAWTAASFRISTAVLAAETKADKPAAAIRLLPRVAALAGGVPIEAGGSTLGGIGVSGAPGGDADEACARAGLEAIRLDLEM